MSRAVIHKVGQFTTIKTRGFTCLRSYSSRAKRAKQQQLSNEPCRTRFAPSPTGSVHLGSLRTALFNYLLAKKTKECMKCRSSLVIDGRKKRTVKDAEQGVYDILRWANLHWDEGPVTEGRGAPYRQSERIETYGNHVQELLSSGKAYRCFCSETRLKLMNGYDRYCAQISDAEAKQRAETGEKYIVRLKSPDIYPIFKDAVYGDIQYGTTYTIEDEAQRYDDIVLLKSNGWPTYHLANVVDDHLMEITHVIRGTEWMPSTPKHVFLYEAFGWKPPLFVHVGLLQDAHGQKLSKRHGTIDTTIASYIEKGYLPEAMVNFVALLGWHNKGASDVLSLNELCDKFSISAITKGNTKVDMDKLDYLQRAHIRMSLQNPKSSRSREIRRHILDKVREKVYTEAKFLPTVAYTSRVLKLTMQNFTTIDMFYRDYDYFFTTPRHDIMNGNEEDFTHKSLDALIWIDRVTRLMQPLALLPAKSWTAQRIKNVLAKRMSVKNYSTDKNGKSKIFAALRMKVSGGKGGPSIYEVMEILGRSVCIARLGMVDLRFMIFGQWEDRMRGTVRTSREAFVRNKNRR